MTDLEELREALHTRPYEPLPELDIQQIMVAGGRLRRRQQIRNGLLSVTVLSVLVGGMALSQVGGAPEVQPAGLPTSGPTAPASWVGPPLDATPTAEVSGGPSGTAAPTATPTATATADSSATNVPSTSPTRTPSPTGSAASGATPTSARPSNTPTASFVPDSSPTSTPLSSPTR